MLFVNTILGMDGIEYLSTSTWFNSTAITPTNITLTFHSYGNAFCIWKDDDDRNGRWLQYDEEFVLSPGQRYTLSDCRHVRMFFTPVVLKNQRNGFQIVYQVDNRRDHDRYVTEYKGYVALSDTPVPVGEEDVEMIMENGEWKKFEREAPASPPSHETPKPDNAETETPVETIVEQTRIIEDEPSPPPPVIASVPAKQPSPEPEQEVPPPSRLWLYIILPLLLAIGGILYSGLA